MTKDKENMRCLKLKVINSKTSHSQATHPCELEDRNEEQNEVTTIQGELLSGLLCHLDTLRSMGSGGSWWNCSEPFSSIYQQSWLTRKVRGNATPDYRTGRRF